MMGERICQSPRQIKEYLDHYVVGQETAKRALSTAAYYQLRREKSSSLPKQTLFIAGDTGCGKTYMIDLLSKILQIPSVIVDAKSLTNPGFEGMEPGTVVEMLYQASHNDVAKAEKGIVCIDEADKLCIRMSDRQRYEKGIEYALLKMIEGTLIDTKKLVCSNHTVGAEIDTSNILFIFLGSFSEILDCRAKERHITGFGDIDSKEVDGYPGEITRQDLLSCGFGREFVGRITDVITLERLTERDYIKILKDARNNVLARYERLFWLAGANLRVCDDAYIAIAHAAAGLGIGARGLSVVVDRILSEAMYEVPSSQIKEVIITAETVRTGRCIYRDAGGMRVSVAR